MKNSFLDYYKLILEKVSFDSNLLAKEYQKAVKSLKEEELKDFHQWMETKQLNLQMVNTEKPNQRNFRSR